MLDNEPSGETGEAPVHPAADTAHSTGTGPAAGNAEPAPARRTRRRPAKAAPPSAGPPDEPPPDAVPPETPASAGSADAAPRTRRRRATKATAATAATAASAGDVPTRPDTSTEPAIPIETDFAGVSPEISAEPVEESARRTRRRTAAEPAAEAGPASAPLPASGGRFHTPDGGTEPVAPAEEPAPATRTRRKAAPVASVLFMPPETVQPEAVAEEPKRAARGASTRGTGAADDAEPAGGRRVGRRVAAEPADDGGAAATVEAVEAEAAPRTRRRRGRRGAEEPTAEPITEPETDDADLDDPADDDDDDDDEASARRRRRRGRRGRGRGRGGADDELGEDAEAEPEEPEEPAEAAADEDDEDGSSTRRRRRRRRKGAADSESSDDPNVVVKIREPRAARDEVQGVSGSTRLEAKRQRRRDGREQRRTRPPILSEAEFLARREAVDRVMVVRQKAERTQIAVLEDGILVEHYVTRASSATMVGSVFLGRVQNVLPSMEAAFVDVGRGRNAVLYAGEVNWDASGLEGRTRTIEQALRSGDSVLVQVTKDPIGTKGARLTSHIALSGRHLVYVPHGNASGISRKLPDVERKRLRDILKNLVPEGAGVIVRTAAEGASEDELSRDVARLQAQWEAIRKRATSVTAPAVLDEEPDLVIRVVRDLFNEDFKELVIQGTDAYEQVEPYLDHVSPDLVQRLRRYTGTGDVFNEMRIDEQLMKALDRKVYLPSGGSLVIDRTEAMTVIDVNTGKYTGAGGNLEETVTRNNLEAAEEIVRQLRLRDIGGIIVIDFIDMVLESNRELVLRRLTECLGRDRTKHQVTEITSLGLVQMTRKRVGHGLLEAFSETCEHCRGRGLIIHPEPIPEKRSGGGNNGDRAALAKVAAASGGSATASSNGSSGGSDSGSGPGEGRSGRRRGRRGSATAVAEATEVAVVVEADPVGADPVEDDLVEDDLVEVDLAAADRDPAGGVADGEAVDAGPTDVGGAPGTDGGSGDADPDAPADGELRRRTRRGGTRRRTRP